MALVCSSVRRTPRSRLPVRGRALLALALAAGTAAGCGGGTDRDGTGNGDGRAAEPDSAVVERLRALPYAGSAPADAAARDGVTIHDPARTQPGLRLVTIQPLATAELIEPDGTVVRRWSDPAAESWEHAELLPDGGLLAIGFDPRDAAGARGGGGDTVRRIADDARTVTRLDREGRTVWRRSLTAHHDAELAPDGRIAVLTFVRRVVPLIDPDVPVRDDRVTRLDLATGEPLEHHDLLAATLAGRRVFPLASVPPDSLGGEPWIDLFHANSLEWMRDASLFGTSPLYAASHVLLCFRHQDRVAILDTARDTFVWAWGEGELSGPHDAQLLPGGNVLVFDNGLATGRSRALEVDPRTDAIVWRWQADPPESFFTPSKGSVQRLPNGNALLAESDSGRAIEVAPDGTVVWEWLCPHRTAPGRRATIVRMRWVGEDERAEPAPR